MIDESLNRQKNERLLLSKKVIAKCGLVFILTQESACFQRLILKPLKGI